MANQNQPFVRLSAVEHLMPQEELLQKKTGNQKFLIGVPKETVLQEKRVALVPSAAALLVENGHRVLVERGAGIPANFEDRLYAEAGVELVDQAETIYQSDIVLKVAPPTLSEIQMMKERLLLISALHQRAQTKEFYKSLMQKKVTALSYEHIRNNLNENPVLHAISEIVGTTSILIASEYLSHPQWGRGKLLGGFTGINPSEVVILGAGTVAESAARIAIGLGALVKVFDNSISKLRRLQNNLNTNIFTSIIQPDVLRQALTTADVAIGALYIRGESAMPVVSEEMVSKMKKGSVIIDVSIDQGGCFETSHETNHLFPVYQKMDVTHYCVPNISSRTPHTASYALSNYFAPFILEMAEVGGINQMLVQDWGIRKGIYLFNGKLTFGEIAKRFGLSFQDLNLMLVTYR
jgi:alanine dehydrogenase